MTTLTARGLPVVVGTHRLGPITIALAVMWGSAVGIAVFSPDLISGSYQEHVPLAAITVWFFVGISTAFILTAASSRPPEVGASPATGWWISIIWIGVALASIFSPVTETGTDPTRVPIAVVIAPLVGMIATGFVAIMEASGRLGDTGQDT